jgi:CheY-like chemotaxis protein
MTTVLVVEDEPLIAFALEAELEDAGYSVLIAPNGRQALELLARGPRPDLVLTDMMMPVMSGPEMLATIAADPDLSVIPVIVLSSLPEAAVRARVGGVAAILRKPCTAQRLLATVAQVLGA